MLENLDRDYSFSDYEKIIDKTAIYPGRDNNDLSYPALGLGGETGEVLEKVKKIIRDKDGVVDDDTRRLLAKELGDVLWYLTAITLSIGYSLGEVAYMNVEKLLKRRETNTLNGSGDDREITGSYSV